MEDRKNSIIRIVNAVVLTGIGGLDNLQYTSITTPSVKFDNALIKVAYCGINHLDLHIRRGTRKGPDKFPHILGSEIVGEIAVVFNSEKKFKVGDFVSVYPWTFCGKCKQCKQGCENICDYGGTIGRTQWGGYAEYAIVPLRNLIKIADKKLLSSACAVTLAGTTAYHLIERGKIRDKSTVLVTGATGGVGTIGIQLLKNKKCKVLSATSHKEKIPFLKKLGADEVFLNKKLITDVKTKYPTGVDYVVDIMGGEVWTVAVQLLAKNGTIVFCSTTLDVPGTINITQSFARQVNILGSCGGTIADLQAVIKLLGKGKIRPVIDSIYPLEKAGEAQQKLENQKAFGKILLKI